MPCFFRTFLFTALTSLIIPLVGAHTWIEQYQVIGPNGSYIGDDGYSRGYVARTDPTFDGDANILWLIPPLDAREPDGTVRLRVNSSDLLCHPNQRTSNYSNSEYPKLKAAPGNYVAMKYYENGHVTLPWNQPGKPRKGGTVFVFGTTQPSENEKIVDVMKWTRDGKGGDGRGFLMTAQNFDDGRCHQINNCVLSAERQVLFPNYVTNTNTSAELWCETDLKIPKSQKPGSTLTTYWVWQWPTAAGVQCIYPQGKDEYYTTCADFDIIEPSSHDEAIDEEPVTNTLLQWDFQTAAVSTYKSRTALTYSPSVVVDEWSNYNATMSASNNLPTPFVSACSITAAAQAAAASAGVTPSLPPSCPPGKWATGDLFASISASVAEAIAASSIITANSQITGIFRTSKAHHAHKTKVDHQPEAPMLVTVTVVSTVFESGSIATGTPTGNSASYSFVALSSISGALQSSSTSSETSSTPAVGFTTITSGAAKALIIPTGSSVVQEQKMDARRHARDFLPFL